MIVFLLSMFSEGIATCKRWAEIQRTQIVTLLAAQVNPPQGMVFDARIVTQSTKQLNSNEASNKRRSKLLTPTRQILRIYSTFLFSLLCIMIRQLVKDKSLNIYDHSLSVWLIVLSLLSFIGGVLILRQVVWAVVHTKQLIAEEKAAISVGSQ